ncbi:MAG: ATP phosphoribosyltransferase [Pseudomonadota bacterium]
MLEELGFSKCRLCIAVPKGEGYKKPTDLTGKRIATSYSAITQDWLKTQGIKAFTVNMNGAHEIAPRLGVADVICDIVSTGATLEANGLEVAETIYHSQALLIGSVDLSPARQRTLEALLTRVRGVLQSRHAKYVMMNAPRAAIEAIRNVLPGQEAPTILELAGSEDKVAIHAVCEEDVLWEHLSELKSLGASAILVLDIDKMLP